MSYTMEDFQRENKEKIVRLFFEDAKKFLTPEERRKLLPPKAIRVRAANRPQRRFQACISLESARVSRPDEACSAGGKGCSPSPRGRCCQVFAASLDRTPKVPSAPFCCRPGSHWP